MADKISFPFGPDWGVIGPGGDHKLPVASRLGHRFQLAGGKVVDRYGGVSDDEVQRLDALEAEQRTALELDAAREELARRIKAEAATRIADLDWKVERARERDALNDTTTLQGVLAEREAIRAASYEAEAAVAKLGAIEEIRAFSW